MSDLDMILYRGSIFKFRLFSGGYELLNVIPLGLENRSVIRYWVIGAVGCRHFGKYSELASALSGSNARAEVGERRGRIEQRNVLDVLCLHRLAPVGIENFMDASVLVGFCETTVRNLFAEDANNLGALLVKHDDSDTPAEVLEILTNAKKIGGNVVVQEEILDLVFNGCSAGVGFVLKSGAVAHLCVKELARGEGFVILYFLENVVREFVITAPRYVGRILIKDPLRNIKVFPEDSRVV
jgi:hypothetical protein